MIFGIMNLSPPSPPGNGFKPASRGLFFLVQSTALCFASVTALCRAWRRMLLKTVMLKRYWSSYRKES